MRIDVSRVPFDEIVPLRELHRDEMGCQIVHDSLPRRGLSHCYLFRIDGGVVGYGTVFGIGDDPKETVDELFVRTEHRGRVGDLFQALVAESGARRIQAQTNDPLMTLVLFDHGEGIERERILFHDGFASTLEAPGAVLRRATEEDAGRPFDGQPLKDFRDWLLELDGEIVATGGILFHYNPPYGDLYMAVADPYRRRGYGSFLIQELKRECYAMGKVPAARCNAENVASRATLQKAGMLPCGSILTGVIRTGVRGD